MKTKMQGLSAATALAAVVASFYWIHPQYEWFMASVRHCAQSIGLNRELFRFAGEMVFDFYIIALFLLGCGSVIVLVVRLVCALRRMSSDQPSRLGDSSKSSTE